MTYFKEEVISEVAQLGIFLTYGEAIVPTNVVEVQIVNLRQAPLVHIHTH